MSTKALKSQLLAAVAMVLVASIALGSSTYAWFAVNNKVDAKGLDVKTEVSNNLFIAAIDADATTMPEDSAFVTVMELTNTTDTDGDLLQPVSTINGVEYFYNNPANVAGNGSRRDTTTHYLSYEADALNTAMGTSGAVGYVDYTFALKAVAADNTSKIDLTKLALTYAGAADAGKAHRVAVFVEAGTGADLKTVVENGTAVAGNLKSILSESGAANFTSGKAVSEVNTLAAVTNPNTAVSIAAPAGTSYYRVIIRLWLEGEDNTCNNTTYMDLNKDWTLDIAMKLQKSGDTGYETPVTAIAKSVTTA